MNPDKLINHKDCKSYRNHLRTHSTHAEIELWQLIKNRQVEGLKLRRQQSIGAYIVDFYCPQIRLAIELDGQVHVGNEEYDDKRTNYIKEKLGIHILRYENKFVYEHPDCILEDIKEYLEKRTTTSPPQK
ncbi:DUF559 domain-containing protein [Parabacteroides sp. PF5-6]|uniref:endonuclease domain-containing protein n=1 Tax=Parabacteroides sp. PF5-6 TaxID=1742403 RepID=UPI002406CF1B|nr:DUF559 domain-containing protein [Parabacteroides sp. PF5-6]MDF9830017.1 very-short-patch-repair endonuclease [Parabacteroides sp. PF5-6]